MPIEKHVTRQTGIYTEYEVHADDPQSVEKLLLQWAERKSIDWQLKQIEPVVLSILREHGAIVEPFPKATEWRNVQDVGKDAPPIVRDAAQAVHWIDRLRQELRNRKTEGAAYAALQLGYFVERMGIRGWEPHAARGMKVLQGASKAHKKTHGDESEKLGRWEKFVAAWLEIRNRNPALSDTATDKRVAEQFTRDGTPVSARTIYRARHRLLKKS